ncbi:MAG: TonB-dependent receptor plug domain-containing protein, partial [Sphingobacteriaceae bacterium]
MNSNFTYYVKMFLKRDRFEISQLNSSQLPEQSFRYQSLKAITSFLLLFVFMFSLLLPGSVNAQTNAVTIKGVVLDDQDGSPLPGVGITDSQKRGLGVTNARGEFTITVPKGTQVQFSFIGSAAETRTFTANQTGVSIRLKPENKALTEVVVTALGIKREEKSLGYATTTVQGEQLTDAPSTNWTDALSGKVAGLNMVRSNSGPAGSNKIILRGENNLTGDNEALIVVDGVVVNNSSGKRTGLSGESAYGTSSDNMPADYGSGINDINPEDIESVTILKGPGAAALYGQRGANGAVIITTKSGSASKTNKVRATFTSNASIESVNRWPDMQYEYGQGLDGADYYSYGAGPDGSSTSGTSSAYGPRFDGQMFYQYDPVTQAQGLERTPWVPYPNKINDFFGSGHTLQNSLSLDGKVDPKGTTTARFSASNLKNSWIIPNTGLGRNNVSLAITSKAIPKLNISTKLNYSNSFSDNLPGNGYGNQSIMYWYIFWQPNADLDWLRNYWVNGKEGRNIEYPYSSFPENPYAVSYEFINRMKRDGLTGNVQASYSFTKNLSLMLRTTFDLSYKEQDQERPYDAGSKLPKGSFRSQEMYAQETGTDFLFKYDKKVNDDFNLTFSGGGSILKNKYNKRERRADSLAVPGIYNYSNALGELVYIPDTSRYRINSFYGFMNASYKDYLYLDITGRQDWNSVLATRDRTDNVGFFYPSASLSFIASEYFDLPRSVSFAKLRFSASQVGSGSTTPYRTSYAYPLAGNGIYPGGALVNPTLLPNPDLKPL